MNETSAERASPVLSVAAGSADELTQRKTRDIIKRGYRITGFILLSESGKESCFVDRSAVRWLDEQEWWTLMHPPCTAEPLTLTYTSPNNSDEQ